MKMEIKNGIKKNIHIILRQTGVLLLMISLACSLFGCANIGPNGGRGAGAVNIAPEAVFEEESVDETLAATDNSDGIAQETSAEENAVSENTLVLDFIDVGHGDSLLIRQGAHAMLVDCGEADKAGMIIGYLKSCEVEKLEMLVLTHPDKDHIGGANAVLSRLTPDLVLCSGFDKGTVLQTSVETSLDRMNIENRVPEQEDEYQLGGAVIRVLSESIPAADANNSSLILKVSYGSRDFLLMGDAGKKAEKKLLESGEDIASDVIKIGHHGGKDASGKKFLSKTGADYAIISCNKNGEDGGADEETLTRLSEQNMQVYRTDDCGTIRCVTDGEHLEWQTE